MRRSSASRTRCSAQDMWCRLVLKLFTLMKMTLRWMISNTMVRELKHRAPALEGYVEAILMKEMGETTMPSTLPPSTTNARGQTPKIHQTGYPMNLNECPHELPFARRLGNRHGRFLECTLCGKIKKALAITKTKVTVYAINHGVRNHPGGKIMPVGRDQFTRASWDSLEGCYALSSSSASTTSATLSRTKATAATGSTNRPTPKAKAPPNPYVIDLESSPNSENWETVGMETEDEL